MALASKYSGGVPRKILIVEDHNDARQMLSIALGRMGFEVLAAAGGSSALQLVREKNPTIVLLDIGLADAVDGLTVCETLCALAPPLRPYVVITSGRKDQTAFDLARRAGANAYLVKPFRLSRLVQLISADPLRRDTFFLEMDQ